MEMDSQPSDVDIVKGDSSNAPETSSDTVNESKKMQLMSWINKSMKIEMTDGRILIGTFVCTDKDANVILSSCSELFNTEKTGISEEPRMLGLVMIPGRHIISIHLEQACPVHEITTVV
ncbi:N-alpha-acetyltransferase 38, NatC auxiliary subunit [Planococcus citri]|uniref:N-alpha-acetyltransferase 38, NatC auxiliary subunit n=1 Tax=Planococcus citri TaxID=170843 RepID=UPI0031F8B97B